MGDAFVCELFGIEEYFGVWASVLDLLWAKGECFSGASSSGEWLPVSGGLVSEGFGSAVGEEAFSVRQECNLDGVC